MPEALDFGPFLLLNDEARARLRAATTRVRFAPGEKLVREDEPADAAYAPGEVLLREGERGDDAFLIRVGQVEVVRGEGAQQRALSTLGPGSFVGEVSALTGGPRTATVRAKTAVQAFRLPGEDVRPVVRKHRLLVGRLETSMQARHAPRRVGSATVEAAPDEARAVILRDANAGTYLRLTHEALAIYEDL